MAEWPEARQIASQYHSPGATGIGFAVFASTGEVTPELWDNIRYCEANASQEWAEGWGKDMTRLRELLEADGITEQEEADENDEAADRAAVALASWYEARNGEFEFYGDEGSPEFEGALQGILVDLRHLAWRSGLDYLALDEAASNRYMADVSEEFQASVLMDALKAEGFENVTCEDTGGGVAVISIDGGIVQIGPGSFGGYGPATFDTEELTFSFYEVTEDDAEEIENSYRQIERGTSVPVIAAVIGAAYRAHKIARGEK